MTNTYATLTDYKAYATARGQTASSDTTDDGVITNLLTQASRYLDRETKRQYYPSAETRLYDIPFDRDLLLDNDLLSVTAFTNGDALAISSGNYLLKGNRPPYWCISLRDISTVGWTTSAAGSTEQVLSLAGVWGYHNDYTARGWAQVGTLGAAITDTTTLAFTASGGHSIVAGNILKVDSEFYNVASVATNTITPTKRGDNESTAATHSNGTAIYAWQPMEEVKQIVLEMTNSAYLRRFGKNTGESATITAAGVVLSPRDVPATAQAFINDMRRKVWR